MSRMLPIALALAALPRVAPAATVDVLVRDASGRPVPDAVVQVTAATAVGGAARLAGPFVMRQQDISFQPHVLVVPVGAEVAFPNADKVRHHVYSFSKPKNFQLKLYGQEETRTVTFDKPGVVPLGCNIHDRMNGFIVVVATPYAGKTDAGGHVRLANVPAGAATLALWSPAVRAPNNQLVQQVTIAPAGLQKTLAIGG